jgi:DNA-directed RNA polymerase subunit E"
MILADKVDQCPHHPAARVSTDWQGFVIIMQPDRSEIAKRLNVTVPGQYALKVNIYT